uniref:DUF3275 family protein n=1 Tax=Pseudomonas amygdali TaxID=47877 RepID=UPI000A500F7F
MINLPGELSIRTIQGSRGAFNVGRLITSIGEFVVKEALGNSEKDFLIWQNLRTPVAELFDDE